VSIKHQKGSKPTGETKTKIASARAPEIDMQKVDLSALTHLPSIVFRGRITSDQLRGLLHNYPDTSQTQAAPTTNASPLPTRSHKTETDSEPSNVSTPSNDVRIIANLALSESAIPAEDHTQPFIAYALDIVRLNRGRWSLSGRWSAAISLACARCANEFLFHSNEQSLELELIEDQSGVLSTPTQTRAPKSPDHLILEHDRLSTKPEKSTDLTADTQLASTELDQLLVDPRAVDLADILIDTVLLETPMIPKCLQENCKVMQTQQETPNTHPPWKKALAALKN